MRVDHVVIGGGIAGTCAAYHLSADGRQTLLIERGERLAPRNPISSSGDATKCFRAMYGGDREMTRLSMASLGWWKRFQDETGKRLLTSCGLVAFGAKGESALAHWHDRALARCVEASAPAMEAEGAPFEILSVDALVDRFPQIQASPTYDHAMLDRSAGILDATVAVGAIGGLVERNGGQIWTDTAVVEIVREGGTVVKLITTQGDVRVAKSVVLAAGYMNAVLAPELRRKIRISRQQVIYFRPAGAEAYLPERLPIVIDLNTWRYALPVRDGAVKVADDDNGMAEKYVDPSTPVDATVDACFEQDARRFLREFIPGLSRAAVGDARACVYTNTLSESYLIYSRGNAVVVSACSGHGFKNGPMTGLIAADLARGKPCPWYYDAFRYNRAADFPDVAG